MASLESLFNKITTCPPGTLFVQRSRKEGGGVCVPIWDGIPTPATPPPSGPPSGLAPRKGSCLDPTFSGPGHLTWTVSHRTQPLIDRGCKSTGVSRQVGRSFPEIQFCCPPPGTCPAGTKKEVTWSGPSGDEANRMAEMGISVPVSVPITKCVPIPGYVLPGNGQSVSDGNTEGKAQSPKPFYKHPLFLIAAGGAVVYLLVR